MFFKNELPKVNVIKSQSEVPLSFRHDSGASVHYTPSVSQSVQYPNVPQPRTAPQQQVRPSKFATSFLSKVPEFSLVENFKSQILRK